MKLINIGVAGCLGRMGQELVKEIINNQKVNFSGGFENPNHEKINIKISDLIDVSTSHIVSDNPKKIFEESDVIIDFTTPKSTLENVLIAKEKNKPVVIGTTGLSDNDISTIKKTSEIIPILQSSNMSIGVNLMFKLIEKSASILNQEDYDIEISETHHQHKIDAPSGTAITIGKYAAKARNINFDAYKAFDRTNKNTKRKEGEIGFAVSRGGEIAGEHTISFIGKNDKIEINHKAYNRSIFVKGAIESAIFLSNKKNGFYSIEDVIG